MASGSLSYLVEDDILHVDQPIGAATTEALGREVENSQLTDTVYIQNQDTFKPTSRKNVEKLFIRADSESNVDLPQDLESTIRLSIMSVQLFGSLGFIVQGLIAGFSVFHAMLVILRTPPRQSYLGFIEDTHNYALIFHCLYYAALTISLVSLFDKYDVASNPRRVIWRAITLQSTGLSAFFWLLALMLSLACLPTEMRMDLYKYNTTVFDWLQEGQEELSTVTSLDAMRALIVARAIAASIGWILVALRPGTNQLRKHLQMAEPESKEQ